MSETLYNQDFQKWLEQTIHQLENGEFAGLDIEHLIEELTDLGRSEKNTFRSNLKILLAHLLKLRVQREAPDAMKASWYTSVLEHRQRLLDNLEDTPSFKRLLPEMLEAAYPDARKLAIREGKLAQFGAPVPAETDYPATCPFTIAQILDHDYYG
jgi:hypothetical protein